MIRLPKSFSFHWFLFALSLSLLGAAFFFEYAKGLAPCPLCVSQRIVVAAIGLFSLNALLFRPNIRMLRFCGFLLFLISALGITLASRQLYLESLPVSAHNVCMPGLNYLVQILPWQGLVKSMLLGGPECGAAHWHFLGLTMAGWLLIVFIITLLIGLLEIIRKHSAYNVIDS